MVFDNRAMAENEQDVVDRHNSQAKNKDWVRKIVTKEYCATCHPVVIEGGINKKAKPSPNFTKCIYCCSSERENDTYTTYKGPFYMSNKPDHGIERTAI